LGCKEKKKEKQAEDGQIIEGGSLKVKEGTGNSLNLFTSCSSIFICWIGDFSSRPSAVKAKHNHVGW
jgi:hypothetical protein